MLSSAKLIGLVGLSAPAPNIKWIDGTQIYE
jgi:hypothetical protein